MADSRIVGNLALIRGDDGKSDAHTFAKSIAKKKAITGPFQKRRQQREAGEDQKLELACSSHSILRSAVNSCSHAMQNFRQLFGLILQRVITNCVRATGRTHRAPSLGICD